MHWKLWLVLVLSPLAIGAIYFLFFAPCETDKGMQDLHKPGE